MEMGKPIVLKPTIELRRRIDAYRDDVGMSLSEFARRAFAFYLAAKEKGGATDGRKKR